MSFYLYESDWCRGYRACTILRMGFRCTMIGIVDGFFFSVISLYVMRIRLPIRLVAQIRMYLFLPWSSWCGGGCRNKRGRVRCLECWEVRVEMYEYLLRINRTSIFQWIISLFSEF